MPLSTEDKNRGIDFDRDNSSLRARLINIFLLIFIILIFLFLISMLYLEPINQPHNEEPEVINMYVSTFIMLVGISVIYVIKRWISIDVAGILLLLLLTLAITVSDDPGEVSGGRSVIFFTLPIVIASVLIRPWASFIFAGLCSFSVIILDVVVLNQTPNIFALMVFFLLALAAWLFARARDTAMRSLYQSMQKNRESDEKIQSLAKFPDESPNPIMRIDSCGKLIYANKGSQEILDFWNIKIGEPIPEIFQGIVNRCLSEETQKYSEIEVNNKVFSLVFNPILNANYINVYGKDETERISSEKALRDSEQRYRQLFDTMHDGFSLHEIICDEQGKPIDYKFLEVNPAFEKITGLSAKDIIGKTAKGVLPDLESIWIENYGQVALTGESLRFENYSQDLDKYFEVVVYRPRPNQFAVLSVDVTERKTTEIELQKSREREKQLAEILDNASQPFATGYRDGKVATYNAAFVDLLGYPEDEMKNVTWIQDITPPEWVPIEKEQLAKIDATGQPVRYEKELIRKDGRKIPVELLVHLVKGEQDKSDYYYAFITDLTERKKAEQAIRNLNIELEQRVVARTEQLNNTLTELESFAYSVSHDLRAPLRAIDGFSQALSNEYSTVLTGDGLHYLERVRAGVKRMDQLIGDILKLSRVTRQDINYEQVDLSRIARSFSEELNNSQPNRNVQWQIMDGLKVIGDANLLKLAIGNLLDNAWKFTAKKENAQIQFGCLQEDSKDVFYVRDNGIGFDMAYADKLFGAFQRLHSVKEFSGTGVGLATVQRIIHRHGGRIWADAIVNQGAVFYFTFNDRTLNIERKS